jgi:hypothetical protein
MERKPGFLKSILTIAIVIPLLCLPGSLYSQNNELKFTHFYVEMPLEPSSYGTGGFSVNDYDDDGDMDITIQRHSTGKVYWYQNTGMEKWVKYEIADGIFNQLGSSMIDVNRDGKDDLVMGGYWLENPGNLLKNPDKQWIKHNYEGGMVGKENHDIVAADINNDGMTDIVAYCQKFNDTSGVMRWYDTFDPLKWKFCNIDTMINKREKPVWNNGIHAGFAPNGVGDLNNDGRCDIVLPSGWYENPVNPTADQWILHRWSDYGLKIGIPKTPYGTSLRSWICDFNNDGSNDIAITDCDVQNSRSYIIMNIRKAKRFKLVLLPFPEGSSGSLHSLSVADIDNDGDMDIFSGEQEDPDNMMKPKGLAERGFLWINTGTKKKPDFIYQIINTDNPGWHDTVLSDVDGDGDIDLMTKVWNADEGTDGNPDRKWHISYWRNEMLKK